MQKFEHPMTGKEIQIANSDFNSLTLEEAKKACKELGAGWRLPTIYELEAMYKQLHKNGKGGFNTCYDAEYWSSNSTGKPVIQSTISEHLGNGRCKHMFYKTYSFAPFDEYITNDKERVGEQSENMGIEVRAVKDLK
jgi:hypothetical protein